jgi:DNA polymerase (family 10)
MAVQNSDIADKFEECASLLDIEGENKFRVRAYKNAAQTIRSLSEPARKLLEAGEDLSKQPGIGKDLAKKIELFVETGSFPLLDDLKKKYEPQLVELTKLSGVGPRKVNTLNKKLGIKNIEELEKAAKNGDVAKLEGFGEKSQESILEKIEHYRKKGADKRKPWAEVDEKAKELKRYLKSIPEVERIAVAGSYRRKKETVGDLDILVATKKPKKVMDAFASFDGVRDVIQKGSTKTSVHLDSGLQVDCRVVKDESFGSALYYFTGSKAHNIAMRSRAQKKDLKVNEYGIYRGDKKVAGETEEKVFKALGCQYIEPELRENNGEIEAASEGRLPKLIDPSDLRGDLHAHTNRTDGKNTIEQMAKAAKALSLEYLAITDHTKRVTVAKGLNEKAMMKHIEAIREADEAVSGIRLLAGAEVDILEDGSLDLENDVLKELDIRVCSVHYHQNLSEKKMTERILKAMDNPYFNILGHPTGRLLMKREGYQVNLREVFKQARKKGCIVEVNSQPQRLDLNGPLAHLAKDMGVKIAISTDAHTTNDLQFIRYGVYQARRGWIEKKDVINTRKWADLKKLLKR